MSMISKRQSLFCLCLFFVIEHTNKNICIKPIMVIILRDKSRILHSPDSDLSIFS